MSTSMSNGMHLSEVDSLKNIGVLACNPNGIHDLTITMMKIHRRTALFLMSVVITPIVCLKLFLKFQTVYTLSKKTCCWKPNRTVNLWCCYAIVINKRHLVSQQVTTSQIKYVACSLRTRMRRLQNLPPMQTENFVQRFDSLFKSIFVRFLLMVVYSENYTKLHA